MAFSRSCRVVMESLDLAIRRRRIGSAFESIVDGRAMLLNFSGIIFRRMFTP